MARAQQRDLRLRVTEALGPSRRDERHRLKRLQRAARHRQEPRVPCRAQQFPVAIDDRDRSVVDAFHGGAAREPGERNVCSAGDTDGFGTCVFGVRFGHWAAMRR
jgi:hypothetical protein